MILKIFTIIFAISAYVFLLIRAFKKNQSNDDKISFSSFLLWGILDIIMLVNTIRAQHDITLILIYTILTIVLVIILYFKKEFFWNKNDTFVAVLAFVCLVISYVSNPFIGVISGALALFSAGIPNLLKILKQKPNILLYCTILCFSLTGLTNLISIIIQTMRKADR